MENEYSAAITSHRAKNYPEAIEKFELCVKNSIKPVESLTYIGDCYSNLHDLEKAREYFDKSIENGITNALIYSCLGNFYFNHGNFVNAEKVFLRHADAIPPNSANAVLVSKAVYLSKFNQRLYSSALDILRYAIYLDKEQKHPKLKLLELQTLNAMEKYQEVLGLYNDLSFPQNDIESIRISDYEKAIALCCVKTKDNEVNINESIELSYRYVDEFPEFNYPLALCYYTKKDFGKALNHIQIYLKIKGKTSEGFLLRGRIMKELGLTRTAFVSFQKSTIITKKFFDGYIEMAKMLMSINRNDQALRVLEKVSPTQEESPTALMFLLLKIDLLYKLGSKRDIEQDKTNKEKGDVILDQIGELLLYNETEKKLGSDILYKAFDFYFSFFHLKGGYTIDEFDKGTVEIGKGGFGIVTKGRLKDQEVAVKQYIIKKTSDEDEDMQKLFINCIKEMKNMEELQNGANILKFLTTFYVNNQLFIITELCNGGNLRELLHSNVVFPINRRIECLIQIAEGLQHMHSFNPPFIHHDIKALNILLVSKFDANKYNEVKICDFGITKQRALIGLFGTPAWVCPEMLKNIDHNEKADVYSFAILMWEVFSRKTPFEGCNKEEISSQVLIKERPNENYLENDTPPEITTLIKECWEHEPNSRPNMKIVSQRLKEILK